MKAKNQGAELSGVCDMIAARMGLQFPVEKWDMLGRNLALAADEFGFQRFDEFIQWLLITNLNKKQIEVLASYLTISETFFWRETQVFSALTDSILPELIASKKEGDRSIRIWSAGCSTGEEPYSLAIALLRAIPNLKDWKVTILATDINPKALNKAASGIYRQWSFRNCPSWLKTNYFRYKGDGNYEIIPQIKEMVTFANLNLTEDAYPSKINNTHAMDLIFCRNVLMYFTDDWIRECSRKLFHSLNKDGWFVVSSCELSSQVFPQFTPVNFSGAFMYRKSHKGFSFSIKEPTKVCVPDTFFPIVTVALEMDPVTVPDPIPEAVIEIELAPVNDVNIRLLADQGYLPEALSLCDEVIARDKLSIGLYFLRSSILQELDKISEAIASLKRAIYIDPDFIMGHFALGNLLLRQGKPKNAVKCFTNVLELLSTLTNDDIPVESEGLSVKYIREIILANLQKHIIV